MIPPYSYESKTPVTVLTGKVRTNPGIFTSKEVQFSLPRWVSLIIWRSLVRFVNFYNSSLIKNRA
ncbi:hypothetical protein [Nostoc sp.]|uniref:hypothetical protein n=1 Tax=Nostoc sp. TaxID=1180 RepID=UPI002FFBCF8D